MQKFINLNQEQMKEYNIDIIEGAILNYILMANNWADSQDIKGVLYHKVYISKIIDDLPSLGITTDNGMRKYVAGLIKKGFLTRKLINNAPYFAPTDITKSYFFSGKNEKENIFILTDDVLNKLKDNNIDFVKIPVAHIKEKNKGLISNLKELLLFLTSEKNVSDLSEVSADDIIDLWNNYSIEYHLPRVNKGTVQYEGIVIEWNKFRKTFTKEKFNLGLKNYLDDIKGRTFNSNPSSYYNHRFSLFLFLKQKNGILKYMYL